MGAKWVKVDFKESGEGQGGYAKESLGRFQEGATASLIGLGISSIVLQP